MGWEEEMRYVVGLDWIGGKKGWACCRLPLAGAVGDPASFSTVSADDAATDDAPKRADAVVLDAPVGLPNSKDRGGALRECDYGARCLVGCALCNSVFPVPVAGELTEWRRRRAAGERQAGGHIRGLLPAINSAAAVVAARPMVAAESHPEVVFALLAGHHLPDGGKKDQELGRPLRLALLARHGVRLGLDELGSGQCADYIDAAAMALVARAWATGGAKAVADRSGNLADVPTARPLGHVMLTVDATQGVPRAFLSDDLFKELLREGLAERQRVIDSAA